MRAVVFAGSGAVAVREIDGPAAPVGGEAVVRVTHSGICGTDLHLVSAGGPELAPGTVLGHEFVGEVVAVGPAVTRHVAGDVVFGSDFTACGQCPWCQRGAHWHCPDRRFFGTGTSFGAALAGAQAERVLVPFADTTLARLPPGVAPEVALLVSDNLATAWGAVTRGGLRAGGCLAVVGGGPVGQLAAMCALAVGAGRVVVVEPDAERRRFAHDQGALVAAPDEAAAVVAACTAGDGADVVVDAVGGNAVLDAALELSRAGGTVVSVGVPHEERWPMGVRRAFAKELTVTFVVGNSIPTRTQLLAMIAGGAIDPGVVVDTRVTIDEAPDAYSRLRARQCRKAVIVL